MQWGFHGKAASKAPSKSLLLVNPIRSSSASDPLKSSRISPHSGGRAGVIRILEIGASWTLDLCLQYVVVSYDSGLIAGRGVRRFAEENLGHRVMDCHAPAKV